jgi:pyridoxal phosphate enzyme (YggS family)
MQYNPVREGWLGLTARVAAAAAAVGRDPRTITVVAVSKTFPAESVRAAHALGVRAFGENYVQEAVAKIDATADLDDIDWHLIGPLQSNKAHVAAARFAWVQTIDREKIAVRLDAVRPMRLPPLDVCVQVNISGEASKSGVPSEEALGLARAVARLPRLRLRGFMGIPEPTDDAERQRAQFRRLRRCFDDARAAGIDVDTLSMGMSDDLEAAIAEGATMVRVGTAIFGPRPKKA